MRQRIAQKLPPEAAAHRALGFVDLKPQIALQPPEEGHHPLPALWRAQMSLQLVRHLRDAQLALGAVGLLDHHLAYGAGPVAPLQQRLAGLGPPGSQQFGRVLDIEPVQASGALVGLDPLPRQQQVLSRQRRLQQGTSPCGGPCQPCSGATGPVLLPGNTPSGPVKSPWGNVIRTCS
jgi:hypothetical protein